MIQDQFIRSAMLVGTEPLARLAQSKVAIFGIGGVGGHCCDALARAGVGQFHLFDDDRISLSNLNRQLVALHSTIGRFKVEVMKERILDINPQAMVETSTLFYTGKEGATTSLSDFDYVIDCVDTMTAKLDLVTRCHEKKIPIISAMGSANKLDPGGFYVTDLSKTENCPLARIMRKELRKRGIRHLKVVFSKEDAQTPQEILPQAAEPMAGNGERQGSIGHKKTPGSLPFVPATVGLLLASAVVRDLAGY
ncbi:MAG: tRNA threonylcarbamoyladenosine dehydratase [Eubacteriales bacterium]